MKNFFTVTYFVYLKSDSKQSHSISRFSIFKAPLFYDWVLDEKEKIEIKADVKFVITNCGKF